MVDSFQIEVLQKGVKIGGHFCHIFKKGVKIATFANLEGEK